MGMLAITRRSKEAIVITHHGERLRVMVTQITNNRMRFLFDGPMSFDIMREEAKKPQRRKRQDDDKR